MVEAMPWEVYLSRALRDFFLGCHVLMLKRSPFYALLKFFLHGTGKGLIPQLPTHPTFAHLWLI
jgi:hypothetical protein